MSEMRDLRCGEAAWHDEKDVEFLNDSLSKYLHQRCMVGNVGHLWSVEENTMWISYDQLESLHTNVPHLLWTMLMSLVQAKALVLSIFSLPCCTRQHTTSLALERVT